MYSTEIGTKFPGIGKKQNIILGESPFLYGNNFLITSPYTFFSYILPENDINKFVPQIVENYKLNEIIHASVDCFIQISEKSSNYLTLDSSSGLFRKIEPHKEEYFDKLINSYIENRYKPIEKRNLEEIRMIRHISNYKNPSSPRRLRF